MKICVVGGGNIGTVTAAELAYKGHEVSILTSNPEVWRHEISVFNADDQKEYTGTIDHISSDTREAILGAELIFVTYPPFLFKELAKKLTGVVKKNQKLVFLPGSGGVEIAFANLIADGIEIWGLQRVPDIARIKERGRSVYSLGRKPRLKVATIPANGNIQAAKTIEKLFGIGCDPLPNYLCVTLVPSNQILHTSRLCTMFYDYAPGKIYDHQFLFYEEWDDAASELLFKNDAELQVLCSAIPSDLSSVEPLPKYYESPAPADLTRKIRSIKAFRGIKTPMLRSEAGWIPDLNSRYFTADFPFGLNIIRQLAHKYGVPTPSIDETWRWYRKISS